jgi:hypothetical protein
VPMLKELGGSVWNGFKWLCVGLLRTQ